MTNETVRSVSPVLIALAWLVVLIPLAWGVWQTLIKVAQLF
ncbi:MFS transporter small subunit [Deinococcus radiophilus]|nr:hypothetical protein [Deinococcus radiophilus]